MILNRREVMRGIAAAPIALRAREREPHERTPSSKRVIVAGGGIAGLCCAYELVKRGHEVFLLEAAGHVGGHVRTMHDSLADGLYAELGAQHFTQPGYDLYWGYVKEFKLNAVPAYVSSRPRLRFVDGKFFNEEELRNPVLLKRMGFNQKEVAFLSEESWGSLPLLYFAPYMDAIHDEYQPFHVGLDWLDSLAVTDLLRRDGASDTAIRFIGEKSSALHAVWNAAVLKLRGVPFNPSKKFRIEGGNQKMTDASEARLGGRVHLGAPVTAIECGATEVRVRYREFSEEKRMEADYLVCAMSAVMLRQIPVTPAWPDWKAVAINDIPYYTEARVVLQTRDPFWDKDGISSNIDIGAPNLHGVWRSAEEVRTSRALLLSNASWVQHLRARSQRFENVIPAGPVLLSRS